MSEQDKFEQWAAKEFDMSAEELKASRVVDDFGVDGYRTEAENQEGCVLLTAMWLAWQASRARPDTGFKPYVLRKQAEAVEEIVDADPDGRSEDGVALISVSEIWDYAQSLRQQADEREGSCVK